MEDSGKFLTWRRFNAMSHWVATQIVETENLKNRVKLVKHFIKVSDVIIRHEDVIICH